jgi:hypothetical protein
MGSTVQRDGTPWRSALKRVTSAPAGSFPVLAPPFDGGDDLKMASNSSATGDIDCGFVG